MNAFKKIYTVQYSNWGPSYNFSNDALRIFLLRFKVTLEEVSSFKWINTHNTNNFYLKIRIKSANIFFGGSKQPVYWILVNHFPYVYISEFGKSLITIWNQVLIEKLSLCIVWTDIDIVLDVRTEWIYGFIIVTW